MPPRKLPEIEIPFLEGAQPWHVIDATKRGQLDRVSHEERQLIGWCTLPLATLIINEHVVDPMVTQGMKYGFHMIQKDYLEQDLDKDIATTQKEMKSGSARPSFIHLATDPENPDRITVVFPTAQNKYRHVFFDLIGDYKIRSRRGAENIANPPQHVALKRKMSIKANLDAADIRVEVPGNTDFKKTEERSELPILRKHSRGITAQTNIRGFGQR